MREDDIIIIKAIAAILEYMASGKTDVNYTAEALGMLSGLLMDVLSNTEKNNEHIMPR